MILITHRGSHRKHSMNAFSLSGSHHKHRIDACYHLGVWTTNIDPDPCSFTQWFTSQAEGGSMLFTT